jgi:hypothetical protein
MSPRLARPSTDSTPLARYDEMCAAIARAHEVDEVKHIRDKALAFEAYSRQARNRDNEMYAAEIRIRAERKAGELSKQLDTAPGTRTDKQPTRTARTGSTKKATLKAAGISEDQAGRWEKLAAVPEHIFEAAVANPSKTTRSPIPTTYGILRFAEENAARHRRQEPKPLPDAGKAVPALALKFVEMLQKEHPLAVKIEHVLKAHKDMHPRDVSMLAGALRGLEKRAAHFAERLEATAPLAKRENEPEDDEQDVDERVSPGKPEEPEPAPEEAKTDTSLLTKMLGMLGSDHDGEVLSASRKITAELRRTGKTWPDLLVGNKSWSDLFRLEMDKKVAEHRAKRDALRAQGMSDAEIDALRRKEDRAKQREKRQREKAGAS